MFDVMKFKNAHEAVPNHEISNYGMSSVQYKY